jgi:uncharacterized integral membrane protein
VRFIYWVITALVALVVVVFGVSNRAVVTLALFPIPAALQVPLYLAVMAAFIVGFLVGALVVWLSGGRRRAEARRLRRRMDRLQRDAAKSPPATALVKEP